MQRTRNVCLVLIYNHRYDKNIPRLEALYGERFNTILHIVPFYDGDRENVIPVYENSYRFSGYIAQSCQRLLLVDSNTYVFAADDLIINPLITEKNILDCLELADDTPYINARILNNERTYWAHAYKAALMEKLALGSEWRVLLPKSEEARRLLKQNGFAVVLNNGLCGKSIYRRCFKDAIVDWLEIVITRYKHRKSFPFWTLSQEPLFAWNASLPYPLLRGYSDFFVVPKNNLRYFAHLCGIFASMNVFAEMAIPTALNLSSDKCKSVLPGSFGYGAIWSHHEIEAFCAKYQFSLDALLKDFPENKLYIHPIKLSHWK